MSPSKVFRTQLRTGGRSNIKMSDGATVWSVVDWLNQQVLSYLQKSLVPAVCSLAILAFSTLYPFFRKRSNPNSLWRRWVLRPLIAPHRWIQKLRLARGEAAPPIQQVSEEYLLLYLEHPSPYRISSAEFLPTSEQTGELSYRSEIGTTFRPCYHTFKVNLERSIDILQTDGRSIHPEQVSRPETQPWVIFKLLLARTT